jgi:hypothetical protein
VAVAVLLFTTGSVIQLGSVRLAVLVSELAVVEQIVGVLSDRAAANTNRNAAPTGARSAA